jgi:signal transduction histidine kinase
MRLWLIVLSVILFSACSRTDRRAIDRLNDISYAYHYRDADSTESYARRAYHEADGYHAGKAEAMNNLAFVHIVRMQYDEAERLLTEVPKMTDNQIEILIAYVQQMRLCQRRSRNREFHEFRERADHAVRRIHEEWDQLSEHDRQRMLYAETEFAIVNSTYYYYVGLEEQSIEALYAINPDEVQKDTAQYLNYLYNVGAGGIITEGTQKEINQQEFDHLMRCLLLARKGNYPYFAANALEALSEHLTDPHDRQQLIADNLPASKFINPENVADEDLPGVLAENALYIFETYGDVYQIAGAYRTLASCYRQTGDYESALNNLEQALSDTIINQAPDLVASIREQMSVAYAAIDDKQQSDYNRNLYLDLQETTRQDRQLEARASLLEKTVTQLNMMLVAVVIAIVLLLFFLWLFNHMNKRHSQEDQPDDLFDQKQEELNAQLLRLETSERRNLEQRAKISLVNSVTPFIDRIIHELKAPHGGNVDYIRELTDQIEDYNDVLTHWIQLRQGELSLKIESFPLQTLFDMISKSRTAFQMKGVELMVEPTDAVVKADRVLTLFMLNTLADNARKFTDKGGQIRLSAVLDQQYVEISVEDTGAGMSEEQLSHLFDHKIVEEHGFGLLNCKGIIEKYRKVSQLFSVCAIDATSTLGKGSRLFFRLPKGVMRSVGYWLLFVALWVSGVTRAQASDIFAMDETMTRASAYADSAYFSNINGTYERTLFFADSCRYYLNKHYRQLEPHGRYLMREMGNLSMLAPEIKWFHDSLDINYNIILDIRNESAVAALALHQWQLYAYNNRIYTQLFKEMSADNTLGDYCRTMQQSQTNKTIAIILLILMLVSIVPAYYLLYYRHRLYDRFLKEQQRQTDLELLGDELRKAEQEDNNLHVSNAVLDNCLSTLKHETMYYPSRIQQLLEVGDNDSLCEVTDYYRELYGVLSLQATRQVERTKLHLKPIVLAPADDGREEVRILGDETLIRYLFDILRKQSGQKKLDMSFRQKEKAYIDVLIPMPALEMTEEQVSLLFTPSKEHIPYLLCRQIVRDHGEATNRRGCGIYAIIINGTTNMIITLPSVWKTSK